MTTSLVDALIDGSNESLPLLLSFDYCGLNTTCRHSSPYCAYLSIAGTLVLLGMSLLVHCREG